MFPIGYVLDGDGGVNAPWGWHFDPKTWTLTEMAPEACDARPSYMRPQGNGTAGTNFCPWAAYLLRECPTAGLIGDMDAKRVALPALGFGFGGKRVSVDGRSLSAGTTSRP